MKILAATAVATLLAGPLAAATVVSFQANGTNNQFDADFNGISVSSTDGQTVSSVSLDLSADSDAFFDFDGSSNFADALAPVLSTLVGITAADISFSFATSAPTLLTINFAAGSFGDGDSITFGADTDFLTDDPAPGSTFGDSGVVASATLASGASGSSVFARQSSTLSTASVQFASVPTSAVPLPAGLPLLIAGMGVFGLLRRKQS